jgi:tRNA(adenine34) deaminase
MIADDLAAMKLALAAARRAGRAGEVPVGAVLRGPAGTILASGRNAMIARADPTAHAEIVAIRRAGRRTGNYRLTGATLYVTLEPCLMCLGAIAQARIARVVYGAPDAKRGAQAALALPDVARTLHHRVRLEGGLLERDCGALLRGFFRARR